MDGAMAEMDNGAVLKRAKALGALFMNDFYRDIIRMIGLLFAPLLVGTVILAILLVFFAIVGPPG